jgi:hypothetical protein
MTLRQGTALIAGFSRANIGYLWRRESQGHPSNKENDCFRARHPNGGTAIMGEKPPKDIFAVAQR